MDCGGMGGRQRWGTGSSLRSLAFKASKGTYGILFLRPLIHFNANSHHYYYRIRKVPRNHTRCCSQRSPFLLPLTMGAVETRPSRKMPIRSLGVFSQSTSFFTSSNHGLQRKKDRTEKRPSEIARPLGLIIFWYCILYLQEMLVMRRRLRLLRL